MLYRLAEMCGRADVETFAEEIGLREIEGWVRYWNVKHSKVGSLTDPRQARDYLEGLIRGNS